MKRALSLLLLVLIFSCNASKNKSSKRSTTSTSSSTSRTVTSKTVRNVIDHAKSFKGTKYKYGGTTKRGMDCSGLVMTAFQKENISLPRTTSALKTKGTWVDVQKVQEGDLLFFATKKNSRNINHVGIVTKARPGFVEFIHSTTSKGVIISTLSERYWYLAYVQARRVI